MAILGDDQAADLRRAIFHSPLSPSSTPSPKKTTQPPRLQKRPNSPPSSSDSKKSPRRISRPARRAVFKALSQRDASPGDLSLGSPFLSRTHPANTLDPNNPRPLPHRRQIPAYDPKNLSIVSCSQPDWDLAIPHHPIAPSFLRLATLADFPKAKSTRPCNAKKAISQPPTPANWSCEDPPFASTSPAQTSQGDDFGSTPNASCLGKDRTPKPFDHRYRASGWQESCPQNNFRRIIAALIPAGEFCNHKINYLSEPGLPKSPSNEPSPS